MGEGEWEVTKEEDLIDDAEDGYGSLLIQDVPASAAPAAVASILNNQLQRWLAAATLSAAVIASSAALALHVRGSSGHAGAAEAEHFEFLGLAAHEHSHHAASEHEKKTCAKANENCWVTRCCEDEDHQCFMKNGVWAGCMKECKPGEHHSDPEDVRTPWTCYMVQEVGPALPPPGYAPPPAPASAAAASTEGSSGPRADGDWPALFCFAIIRTGTYELGLLKEQYALRASIFGCEESAVLSDKKAVLADGPPAVHTTELGDLSTTSGVRTHFANTDIFSRAFDLLKEEGRMMKADFTVKVDPDAVFMPFRLKEEIRNHVHKPKENEPEPNIYFQNCKFQNRYWMFGAMEVLSRASLTKYFEGRDTICKGALDYYNMGEDTFLARCLDRLGVEAQKDFNLLSDGYCDEAPGDCSSGQVTYHPFKDAGSWAACFHSASRK